MEAATFGLRALAWFMEPPPHLQEKDARRYDELDHALSESSQLDCARNFFSVHVCSTTTLITVLTLEFFTSGMVAVVEVTKAFRNLISLNGYQPIYCVGRAVHDLSHMVKLAVFGTFMVFLCFVAPTKVITLFQTRTSGYRTTRELKLTLAGVREVNRSQTSELDDAREENRALRAWCTKQGHKAPPLLELNGASEGE